ncbi:hypothetical protein AB5I41_03475 [Sphingomonas sp. MMS24-JH45]
MYGASLTKAVFGYTVVMLARVGRVALDRPDRDHAAPCDPLLRQPRRLWQLG